MGNRLHVAKHYRVEYAPTEAFNWQIEEFHNLLSALDVDYTGDTYDEDFEVDREHWQKGLEKLKNLENQSQDEREYINDALEELGYKRKEVIDLFKAYLEASDPDDFYMHFSFF